MVLKSRMSLANLVMAKLLGVLLLMEVTVSGFRFGVDGLRTDYYIMTCPFAEQVVKNTVNRALGDDPTLAAALIRMHFHDCFIEVHSYLFSLIWSFLNFSVSINLFDIM